MSGVVKTVLKLFPYNCWLQFPLVINSETTSQYYITTLLCWKVVAFFLSHAKGLKNNIDMIMNIIDKQHPIFIA